jgi:predicted ester cyclase
MFYSAFPDLNHTIEDTIAERDKVAVRFRLRGTHQGNFMGIPATAKPITVSAIVIMQIAGGKVTELRAEFDQLGMMQQLGVVPQPGS